MGYDVALWGSLKFPEGGVDAWRKLAVDGKAWSDWTMWFENAPNGPPRTVEEHLREWESFDERGEGGQLFSVRAAGSKVDVQAFFPEDVFVEKAQAIAALFRVAERAGATGKVTFAGVGTPLAYRLTLSKKGSSFEALDEDLEKSAEVEKVLRAAEKRSKDRKKAERDRKKGGAAAPAEGAAAAAPESFSVAVWAELHMKSEEALDVWKGRDIEPFNYNDWTKKDGWGWFARFPKPERLSNIEYLKALEKLSFQQKGRDFFRVKVTGLTMEWRGHLEKETFLDRAVLLATVFRSARSHVTQGTLVFAAVGATGGFRFAFAPQRPPSFEPFAEDLSGSEPMKQILADLARRDELRAARAGGEAAAAPPAAASPAAAAPPAAAVSGLPGEAARAMERIYALLEGASPEALVAAPAKIDHCTIRVKGRPARVEETFHGRDAVLAGLRGESKKTDPGDLPSLQSASLLVAGAVAPEAAEPHLRAILLSDAPPELRASAAVALAGRGSGETVEALFRVLPEKGEATAGKFGPYTNGIRRGAEHALASTGRDDVPARALAMLTPEVLAIPAGPTGDFVEASPEAQDKEDFARSLLYILGRAKYRPARDRLTDVFRTHPLREIRSRAAEALLFSASPEEIRAAFGEDPQSFFEKHVHVGVFDRLKVDEFASRLLDRLTGEGA